MSIVLSIDWDFFLFNGLESDDPGKQILATKGPNAGKELPVCMFFDVGSSESHSSFLQGIQKLSQYAGMLANGFEPLDLHGVVTEWGCTEPERFLEEIKGRLDWILEPPVLFADSHTWGTSAVLEGWKANGHEPVNVLHFDAHADLGYTTEKTMKMSEEGSCDCGSWLFHMAYSGYVDEITVVYPDWRAESEREQVLDYEHVQEHLVEEGRLTLMSWSEWLKGGRGSMQSECIQAVNLARSGAWTSPLMDEDFLKLVSGIPSLGDRVCHDCTEDHKIGGFDACKPREFDLEAARFMADGMNGQLREHILKNVNHSEALEVLAKTNEESNCE